MISITAERTRLARKKAHASSGETFEPSNSESVAANLTAPISLAAKSAPMVDPSAYTGAAMAPPTRPEIAPALCPAAAARLPHATPIKTATTIPISEPSNETTRPTPPPMPPQTIPTLTAPPRSSFSSMPAF